MLAAEGKPCGLQSRPPLKPCGSSPATRKLVGLGWMQGAQSTSASSLSSKDAAPMLQTDLGACEWFVWDLRRSNLIDRGQLDQIVGEFLTRHPGAEPPALAEYLVKQT